MLTITLKNLLIGTLAAVPFLTAPQLTSAGDRKYVDALDMCVDHAFPHAVAITLRMNGQSNDAASDQIVQLQKDRFSDFDAMDLGATWRIVDDTYALDLGAWAEQYGDDTNKQKIMWTVKAFSNCLREMNYLKTE